MTDRTCVYVDGESHYIRSAAAWRNIHGDQACLTQLRLVGQTDDRMILVNEPAKVFWTKKMNPGVHRATYFTSLSGDKTMLHNISRALGDIELEPFVLPELSSLSKQRKNVLHNEGMIEKPKQVDIALAVRMLLDAVKDNFDVCHLYTSDVDFLPAIQAVMSYGKKVCVHGYRNGLAAESPLLHVPDQFIDLEGMLKGECEPLVTQTGSQPQT